MLWYDVNLEAAANRVRILSVSLDFAWGGRGFGACRARAPWAERSLLRRLGC